MVITHPVYIFPLRQYNPSKTMESWNTDTRFLTSSRAATCTTSKDCYASKHILASKDCYVYDKDMYDDVCFARSMLRGNLEILRNGSAPPQVRTVICVTLPLCFLVPFLPKNVAFPHSLLFPNHLDHHLPCSPLLRSPLLSTSLSLSPPSFPPSFYSLQERVIGNNSLFIQFAHRYISQNKALNGYIVLSSNIKDGQPSTAEEDLFLGFLCFVCLVPAIYALGEMRDEAMKRHECVCVCVCLFAVCMCVQCC